MERNSIAFAVEHDGPIAVRPDLMNRPDDLTPAGCDGVHCLGKAALGIQIDKRTDPGRCVVFSE